MFGFNALRASEDGSVVGLLCEDSLTLHDQALAPTCRFSGLLGAQCFALSRNVLALFEEERFTLMESREGSESLTWHAVLRVPLTWLAHDCAVWAAAEKDSTVTVVAGSVVGLHRWTVTRSLRQVSSYVLLPSHSIAAVQLCSRFCAAATTDGHVSIWPIGETPPVQFVWFAESGERITSLQFSEDETMCAAVGWDGSGAIFTLEGDEWNVTRLFTSSLLFSLQKGLRPPGPALCVFGGGDVLHVLYNGGLKSHGASGMNVKWVARSVELEGFCKLEKDVGVTVERQGLVLRKVNL